MAILLPQRTDMKGLLQSGPELPQQVQNHAYIRLVEAATLAGVGRGPPRGAGVSLSVGSSSQGVNASIRLAEKRDQESMRRTMMGDEKRKANDDASKRTTCCGPTMEKKMRALFESMCPNGEDPIGSCADRMEEMMRGCCGSFVNKEPTKR